MGMGVGLALGMAVGASMGAALQNWALGIGIGLAIGVAFSVAFTSGGGRRARDEAEGEDAAPGGADGEDLDRTPGTDELPPER